MPESRPRIVVLASGGGTNCQALIDACASGQLQAVVCAIVTNNPDAGVVERAQAAQIPCEIVEHRGRVEAQRRAADDHLIQRIRDYQPDLVVLAGWMRILGAAVGAAFPVINLHPAKPGEFPGIRAIERAYESWQQGSVVESGVMVHWVPDEGVDVGPMVATEVVPFASGDSLGDFAARMRAAEHRLIVAATARALSQLSACSVDKVVD